MTTDRREFLERATLGVASLAALTTGLPPHLAASLGLDTTAGASPVDMSWMRRVRGRHRGVFDVPEIDGAMGVWRSQLWRLQVQDALGAKPDDVTAVLVIRHKGFPLAMQQAYWDAYGIGKAEGVTHPVTRQPTDRNPALLASSRGEIDQRYDGLSLASSLATGTIVLGCTMAFESGVVSRIAKHDGISAEEARTKARALIVPGVIMLPSGIFAAVAAQEAGCHYVRVS